MSKKNDKNIVTAVEQFQGGLLDLSLHTLKMEALEFCKYQETVDVPHLYHANDGKAVGTYIEQEFKRFLSAQYAFSKGSSAQGIDLPDDEILTDIKVTSIKKPQSSSPFRSASQKVYGLGYNLLVFVYEKFDNPIKESANFKFVRCAFIESHRTADFQTTRQILNILDNDGNEDDLIAFFHERNLPGDEVVYTLLAEEILKNPPVQGYLTISNALQWRLHYSRIVNLQEQVQGIDNII